MAETVEKNQAQPQPEVEAPGPESAEHRDRTPVQSFFLAPVEALQKILNYLGEKTGKVSEYIEKFHQKITAAIEVIDESSADRPRYRKRPKVALNEAAKTGLGVPTRTAERLITPTVKTGSSLVRAGFNTVLTGVSALNTALDFVLHPIHNFTKFSSRSKEIGTNLKTTFQHGWDGIKNLAISGGRALNTVKDGIVLNATRTFSDGVNGLKRNYQSIVNHVPLIGPKILHHLARPIGWLARKPHQFGTWLFGIPKRIGEKLAEKVQESEEDSGQPA